MKKILVCSDLHGLWGLRQLEKAAEAEKPFDYLFCCGDIEVKQHDIWTLADGAQCFFVKGNCDYGSDLPMEVEVNIENYRFWMVHGHKWGVRGSTSMLREEAFRRKDNVVLFGHTHIPLIEDYPGDETKGREPLLIVNPGSVGKPYQADGKSAYCVITIGDGALTADPRRI
ncbi:MAG: YfcE family phosphodiesterase [Eubacteriales bacterium]|jgi:putative phosphoesterase